MNVVFIFRGLMPKPFTFFDRQISSLFFEWFRVIFSYLIFLKQSLDIQRKNHCSFLLNVFFIFLLSSFFFLKSTTFRFVPSCHMAKILRCACLSLYLRGAPLPYFVKNFDGFPENFRFVNAAFRHRRLCRKSFVLVFLKKIVTFCDTTNAKTLTLNF